MLPELGERDLTHGRRRCERRAADGAKPRAGADGGHGNAAAAMAEPRRRGMEQLLHGRISFVIAHRLSTIRNADRILVISAGKIAEEGTHRELLERRGEYYRLYTHQFVREHEEEALRA